MLLKPFVALVGIAASFVSALPNPIKPETSAAIPFDEALVKRQTLVASSQRFI